MPVSRRRRARPRIITCTAVAPSTAGFFLFIVGTGRGHRLDNEVPIGEAQTEREPRLKTRGHRGWEK